MPRTPAEAREYARGYNRAIKRHSDRTQHVIGIARGYKARLADADTARVCKNCDRWTRGGDLCHWGYCRADFEWGVEGRMWVNGPSGIPNDKVQIITQPDFGCVSWLPRSSA